MQPFNKQQTKRRGFTLVELVVVVLNLGIIAAIAAPKMFNTAGNARDSATRTSLAVIRDALELFSSQNRTYATAAATLATDLKPFIRGPFPTCQVLATPNANVWESAADPIVVGGAGEGWAYNPTTGGFVINDAAYIAW